MSEFFRTHAPRFGGLNPKQPSYLHPPSPAEAQAGERLAQRLGVVTEEAGHAPIGITRAAEHADDATRAARVGKLTAKLGRVAAMLPLATTLLAWRANRKLNEAYAEDRITDEQYLLGTQANLVCAASGAGGGLLNGACEAAALAAEEAGLRGMVPDSAAHTIGDLVSTAGKGISNRDLAEALGNADSPVVKALLEIGLTPEQIENMRKTATERAQHLPTQAFVISPREMLQWHIEPEIAAKLKQHSAPAGERGHVYLPLTLGKELPVPEPPARSVPESFSTQLVKDALRLNTPVKVSETNNPETPPPPHSLPRHPSASPEIS